MACDFEISRPHQRKRRVSGLYLLPRSSSIFTQLSLSDIGASFHSYCWCPTQCMCLHYPKLSDRDWFREKAYRSEGGIILNFVSEFSAFFPQVFAWICDF
uniref:Uncharacterized protein n=1 Tax=Trypanosoma vivax (strain Y486) TaxID=1055687 RepID=G0TUA0_TRYVY|nr:hypothetical protein TVY486_0402000 [Trypanosoma vivax Y486]